MDDRNEAPTTETTSDLLGPEKDAGSRLTFEDIIETLGSFGKWQRIIFVVISLADVFGSMSMFIPVFIGATPRWHCVQFENLNTTWSKSMSNQTDITDLQTCEKNGTKCLEFNFDDDFTSFTGEWSLVCDQDYLSDTISSIQMVGLSVGAALFGQLSDTYGRKRMYYLAFAIEIGSGMLSALSYNWQMYAVCRFFVGVGFGGYMVINCVYPLEFVGKKWRFLCGTIGLWAVGIMMLAGIAYLIRDWRHLTATTNVFGILFFFSLWIVPESPRWLLQKRRYKAAEVILNKIAQKNNCSPPAEGVLKKFAEKSDAQAVLVKKYSYLDLFRRWKYAKRTLIMILLWFTGFLTYYEISYSLKNLSGDRYLNVFLGGFIDLIAMIAVLLLLNRIGRRISMGIFLSAVATTLLAIVIVITADMEEALPGLILGLALIGKSSGLAGIYTVQILSAELFPTVIRTVGVGSGSIAGRIGCMVAPLFVYIGILYKLAPYIAVATLAFLSIPVVFLLPETNGQPMEDTYDSKLTDDNPQEDMYESMEKLNHILPEN